MSIAVVEWKHVIIEGYLVNGERSGMRIQIDALKDRLFLVSRDETGKTLKEVPVPMPEAKP